MINFLNSEPLLSVLIIVSIGYLIGQINIKGFALESSAILFVSLIAGHLGLSIPQLFKTLGLSLFIYSIGLQAGPKAKNLFKKEGIKLNLLAFIIVSSGAILTIIGIILFDFKKDIAIGLFAGALTSTPGLASASEATQSATTSIGYGIAYPIGVIGVIIFIKLMPLILRVDIKKNEQEEAKKNKQEQTPIISQKIEVCNPNIYNKSISSLNITNFSNCIISRLARGTFVEIPSGDTILFKGDILRVVGTKENIKNVVLLIGKVTEKTIPQGRLDTFRLVVTNKNLLGKKISEIKLKQKYEANVTRVGRSGIDIAATPDLKIEWGDRISIVADQRLEKKLKSFFGDDVKKAEEGNVFSIILGITIGILIGMIPFSIGKMFSFKMGLTGGILLSGLFLSNKGSLGKIIWRVPFNIINLLRELGLIFFLSAVGTGAGNNFMKVVEKNGFSLIIFGAFITIIPMVITLFIGIKKFKMHIFQLFGVLPGAMTSTPGFATATTITLSQTPASIYTTVYPVAMISMIVWTKILAFLPI